MKVFQLNTYCGVKSTGRIAVEIAKLVKADGGECRIGYGIPGITSDSEEFAYRIGSSFERKLHGAMRKLLDAEGYGSKAGTKALIHEIETFQPDLIHLHNVHGCYLNLKMLFKYLADQNLPIVWTLHDCWPFTGHCAYFDYSGCQKWKTGCFQCPQQHSYPTCIGLDGSKRNYAAKKNWFTLLEKLTFVTPCEWLKQPLSASFLKSYPSRVIVNGVNLSAFKPVESDLRLRYGLENKKVCLSVASEWDDRKGLPYLVNASKELGDSYCFVIIGLSQEQVQTLPSSMIGIMHTTDVKELAAWYTAADCFVNPTLEDNMPMVNLESLACGTPVVVFRTGGCPEAIDKECGRVVPKGDTTGLCRAIQEVCSIPKNDWKLLCLQHSKKFDSKYTFRSYLDLYKELCQ